MPAPRAPLQYMGAAFSRQQASGLRNVYMLHLTGDGLQNGNWWCVLPGVAGLLWEGRLCLMPPQPLHHQQLPGAPPRSPTAALPPAPPPAAPPRSNAHPNAAAHVQIAAQVSKFIDGILPSWRTPPSWAG